MARYPFSLWFRAARPFSFTASATPILLGTALAFYQTGHVNVVLFVAALIGGVLVHAGTNLISDYFDYTKGVDREETFGGSRILVEKTMLPKALFAIVSMFIKLIHSLFMTFMLKVALL